MKKTLNVIFSITLIVLMACGCGEPEETTRFFEDQPYNFQVLRTMSHATYGGADIGEVLSALKHIKEGDDETWFIAWHELAERVEKRSSSLENPISRAKALLRAHNYYRTAEFFLHPEDERRPSSFNKSVDLFYEGVKSLSIEHNVITIPFGKNTLKGIYYPAESKIVKSPLIVVHGGYDSTLEELYFMVAAAALERGYNCLTFEGPGQGSVLREQGLRFTPEWEKPTSAVLDEFIREYGKPEKIILIGVSLGGYLAPRAAAYDDRIDGVVAHNVCYDFQEAALKQVPGLIHFFHGIGFDGIVNGLIRRKMESSSGVRWGVRNAQWTMGAKDPVDLLEIFNRYNLEEESKLISCDVLITAGEKDHFFPVEQVERFKSGLVNARSVTARIFTEEEGGHEHCQMGAPNLFLGVLFEWIEDKF